jgi:hypothetical protein
LYPAFGETLNLRLKHCRIVKKRLPYIAPLVFLFILVIPFLSGLVLQTAQSYLKWKAEERMQENPVVSIVMSCDNVYWEKRGKELRINGRLFDINAYTVSNGMLTATGFFDEEEAAIENFLHLLPQDKKHNILAQPFLLLQCFMMILSLFVLYFYGRSSTPLYGFYAEDFTSPQLLVLERPPRA